MTSALGKVSRHIKYESADWKLRKDESEVSRLDLGRDSSTANK